MVQSQTMEERMEMFLDTVEDVAAQDVELAKSEAISDEDIDRLIEAESEAEHQKELDKLSGLRAELDSLKREGEKQKEGGGNEATRQQGNKAARPTERGDRHG